MKHGSFPKTMGDEDPECSERSAMENDVDPLLFRIWLAGLANGDFAPVFKRQPGGRDNMVPSNRPDVRKAACWDDIGCSCIIVSRLD